MKKRSEQGTILIGVLWSLLFLTMLAVAITSYITPQLVLASTLRDDTALHYWAQAGVKRAAFELTQDETEDYDAQNESWGNNEDAFKEIAFEGATVNVGYGRSADSKPGDDDWTYGLADEERKLNINKISEGVLARFFEMTGGAGAQDAAGIAAAVVDWRDEDDEPSEGGAESGYYQSQAGGYACKNAPFEALEELLLVKGVTTEIFEKVKGGLTVFGKGKVNINTAGLAVLEGLGLDESVAKKVVSFREGEDGKEGTEDDRVFESEGRIASDLSAVQGLSAEELTILLDVVNAGVFDVRSDYFYGVAVSRLADRGRTATIRFVVGRDRVARYWREG